MPIRIVSRSDTSSSALAEPETSIGWSQVPMDFDSSHDMDSFTVSTSSEDSHTDDDLLSLSSSYSDIDNLKLNDKGYSDIANLFHGLALEDTATATDGQSTDANGSNRITSSDDSRQTQQSNLTPKKRGRPGKQSEDTDDEEPSFPPSKRGRPNMRNDRERYLACPFMKRDPIMHTACFSRRLSRIRDVKQHLYRRHTPEFYCSRCSAIFQNAAELQDHVGDPAGLFCEPSSLLNGISKQQQNQLSQKPARGLSEEEQWFLVWDTVFPGLERPDSAYIDVGQSEDLCSYREYSRSRGPEKFVQNLQKTGFRNNPTMLENIRKAYNETESSIYGDWRSERSPSSVGSLSSQVSYSRPSRKQSLADPARSSTSIDDEHRAMSFLYDVCLENAERENRSTYHRSSWNIDGFQNLNNADNSIPDVNPDITNPYSFNPNAVSTTVNLDIIDWKNFNFDDTPVHGWK
ncbi:hypothetical protein F4806DRAFT_480882 [Annulohypoxylon nitens]|nr:hypothetical protein F4806DRAFT_480882 [Annulohypoxylon nitens]